MQSGTGETFLGMSFSEFCVDMQNLLFLLPTFGCLLSIAVACATTRLSTCSLTWSVVLAQVRIRVGARDYVKRNQARML